MSYHTFQVATAKEGDRQQQRPPMNRQVSTGHACRECRRRKIRCDGALPCQQCQCTPDNLQARHDLLAGIISRLFPKHSPEELATLSREEMVQLLLRSDNASASPGSDQAHASAALSTSSNIPSFSTIEDLGASTRGAPQSSAGAESLSPLEQAPERDPAADEAQRYAQQMQSLADDVNGLSISVRRKASYVGVSSISAALEVIFKLQPSARAYMAQLHTDTANSSRRDSPSNLPLYLSADPNALPPPDVGQRYIEAYFARVHPLMPMIDEAEFWNIYLYTNRNDTPWLALLNIVLALGAIADPTSNREEHLVFSHRVRSQFSLEMFGSGNLFVLQALGLLAGYYLHWLSLPNEAIALMGAALRMAIAMGLHREFSNAPKSGTAEIPVEIRRRTWWSLICLDTWSAMTTGRPSLGRLGTGVTIEGPKIPEQTNNAQYLASLKLLPIVHNVKFCRLATHIQDRLASSTILPADELKILDADLERWYDELPPILVDPRLQRSKRGSTLGSEHVHSDCPEQLKTPRLCMYWWCTTLRVLAHRPVLLASTMRRIPLEGLSEEERTTVTKCRQLAAQAIEDITTTCPDERIGSWNAVWILYHSTMVPMCSLFLHTYLQRTGARAASDQEVEDWRRQIQIAISFYERKDINIGGKCRTMLQRLYDANENVGSFAEPSELGPILPEADHFVGRNSGYWPAPSDDMGGLVSDMNLDEWLQTYNEPFDAVADWDDMMWDIGLSGSRPSFL